MRNIRPASEMTVAEHTARYLTQHFAIATPEPIVLSEERPVELGPMRHGGRYLAYDFQTPPHRELTFRVLVRGEVKITANGEAVLDFRQAHSPDRQPLGGWHEGWHEVVVWPERFIDGWVRVGVENPTVGSTELAHQGAWACSGAPKNWRPRATPVLEARRVSKSFTPDSRLTDSAWETAPSLDLRKASLVEFNVRSKIRFLYDEENLYLGFIGEGRPSGRQPATGDARQNRDIDAVADTNDIAPPQGREGTTLPGALEYVVSDVMWEEYLGLVLDAGANGRELVECLVNHAGLRDSSRSTRTGRDGYWYGSDRGVVEPNMIQSSTFEGAGFWDFEGVAPGSWGCWIEVGEEGWSACMAMPFALLGRRPSEGDVWHFNACRRTYGEHNLEYFASPHPYQYHDAARFAQLLFGPPSTVPVSADFGKRAPGPRVANIRVRASGDEPQSVTGNLLVDGAKKVEARETLSLRPGEEGLFTFDLNVESSAILAFILTDDTGAVLYHSAPIEMRLPGPEPHRTLAPGGVSGSGYLLVVASQDRPLDWNGVGTAAPEVRLSCRRREHQAFQIGITPSSASLRNVRLDTSDLVGPGGRTIPASCVEWFVEGQMHREPDPTYLLRREIPDHQVRWVPDVLVPVEAFAIDDRRPGAIWVEVHVPAEATLGRYQGRVKVVAEGQEPQEVSFGLEVQGFASQHSPDGVLDIGPTKQLLIDDYVVEDIDGALISYHPFKKHPGNPLIVPDRPADLTLLLLYGTIHRNASTGEFRMWYIGHSIDEVGYREHMCYAESDDGLTWRKPDLGVIEFRGTKSNHLVDVTEEGRAVAPHIIYRPDEPEPDRRYVRYFQSYPVVGTCAAYSSDGIHWRPDFTPLFLGSDAASPTFDPRTGRFFVVTIQDRAIGSYVRRSPAVSMSEDGVSWSDFHPIIWADALDDRRAFRNLSRVRDVLCYDYPGHYHGEFNDMKPYPYAGMYLASLSVFECCGADLYKGTWGGRASGKDDSSLHLQLVSSRSANLREWQRVGSREPMIDRGKPGNWDAGFITAADAPVVVGDELWLYYGGLAHSQQNKATTIFTGPVIEPGDMPSGIGLATIRLDGFVSLDADAEQGRLITKKLLFSGKRLEVNAAVRGSLRVAVLDGEGHALPGFGERDCVPLSGDSVRHEVRWNGGDDLHRLTGRPTRLSFHLQDAEFYAFQFVG